MALAPQENSLSYQLAWSRQALTDLLHLLERESIADCVVFDCTSDLLTDNATLLSLIHI